MIHSPLPRLALLGLLFACTATSFADTKTPQVPLLGKYKSECAACHIAYPPAMLPAPSWKRLMVNLDKHFGTDASLDEASVREISGWLNTHASTRSQEAPLQDRITQTAWFVREHRASEIPAQVWKRASIGSASNCAACHTRADQGDFNEDNIRIPR